MAAHDDDIRRLVEQMEADAAEAMQAHERAQAANFTAPAAAEAAKNIRTEHDAQLLDLCGRFAIWADNNGIPYNSPSRFARGWLLDTTPRHAGSYNMLGDTYDYSNSVALLVTPRQKVRELVISEYTRQGKHRYFSQPAHLEEFSLDSVCESIAQFAFRYRKEWNG